MVRMIRAWAALAAAALWIGCAGDASDPTAASPGSTTTSVTANAGDLASIVDGLDTANDVASAPDVAGMMVGAARMPLIPIGLEAFRCDLNPQIETMTVCGRMFPSSIELSWTDCNAHGPREFFSKDSTSSKLTTSGDITITNDVTLDPADQCTRATAVTIARTTTFDVTTTGTDGSREVAGSVSVTSARDPAAKTFTNTESHDITITETDAAGMATATRHLVGMLTTTFSGADGTRTVSGSVSDTKDGATASVTITDLVRPAFRVCRFPTSGTIVRTARDGTTHTLVFGPTCGAATLDGTAVTLPTANVGVHSDHHGSDN